MLKYKYVVNRGNEGQEPTPMPRLSLMSGPPSFHGSTSSLTSTISRRKKAPAPKPPTVTAIFDHETPIKDEGGLENINDVSNSSMTSYLSTPNSSMVYDQIFINYYFPIYQIILLN